MSSTITVTNISTSSQHLEFLPIGTVQSTGDNTTNPTLEVAQDGTVTMCLSGPASTDISCVGAPESVELHLLAPTPNPIPTGPFDLSIDGNLYAADRTLQQLMILTNTDSACPIEILPAVEYSPWYSAGTVVLPNDRSKCCLSLRYVKQTRSNHPIDGMYFFDNKAVIYPSPDTQITLSTPHELFSRINDWLVINNIPAQFRVNPTSDLSGPLAIDVRMTDRTPGQLILANNFAECVNIPQNNVYLLNSTWNQSWTADRYGVVGSQGSWSYPYDYIRSTTIDQIPIDDQLQLMLYDTVSAPFLQDVLCPSFNTQSLVTMGAYPDTITLIEKAINVRPSPTGGFVAAGIEILQPVGSSGGYIRFDTDGTVPFWSSKPLYASSPDNVAMYALPSGVSMGTGSESAKTIKLADVTNATIDLYSTRAVQATESMAYNFRYIDAAVVPAWVERSLSLPPITLSPLNQFQYIQNTYTTRRLYAVNIPSDATNLCVYVNPGYRWISWDVYLYTSIDALVSMEPSYINGHEGNGGINVVVTPGTLVYLIIETYEGRGDSLGINFNYF